MSYKSPQDKPGYMHKVSRNPEKPEPHRQEPNKLPMIADTDPAGNKVTTNYPMKQSGNPNGDGGSRLKAVEGQLARGHVHNPKTFGVGKVDNGNARRGSPPTIREIPAP